MSSLKLVVILILGAAILVGLLTWWHGSTSKKSPELIQNSQDEYTGPFVAGEQKVNNPNPSNTMNSTAVVKTNLGVIEIELFEDQMPITTGNFIALAKSGFYNNIKFHRVIDGFMIQAGDPNTRGDNQAIYGSGGPEHNVQDEFVKGDLLTNTRGTIAMANTGQPNSGGSQFFINLVDNTGLDFDKQPLTSKHPVFGRVIKGMDVVDAIGKVDTKERDIPVSPVIIESVEIVSK